MTPRGPWLERRDPTVKLLGLFLVSVGLLALLDPRPVLVLLVVAVVVGRLLAGLPWGLLARTQVAFLAFGFGVFLINAVSRPGTPLWPDLPLRVTVEGLTVGAALALRTMVIGVLTVTFLHSTRPRDLMVSLMSDVHLPPRFAYAVLAGQRMLETMPDTWRTVRAAQRVRRPTPSRAGVLARRSQHHGEEVREFGRSAFALLVVSVRGSERIALALESRGLHASTGPMRDEWLRPGAADAVLLTGALLLAVLPLLAPALPLP